MHILVPHQVPDSLVRYAESIDYRRHEVTHVGSADRLATLPAALPARRVERISGPHGRELWARFWRAGTDRAMRELFAR